MMPPESGVRFRAQKASCSSSRKLMLTETSASPKFQARQGREPALIKAKSGSTIAFTLRSLAAPIETRNCGFTKRAIELLKASVNWITPIRREVRLPIRSGEFGRMRSVSVLSHAGHQPLVAGQSDASFSSRIRRRFHKRSIFDSGHHGHRCVAKRTGGGNLVRRAVSKSSLPYSFIPAPPGIEPSAKEWFRLTVEQIMQRG